MVGGALRDAALGRELKDIDLATASSRPLAARLARSLRGKLVTLDEKNAVYRVVVGGGRQIDVAALQGDINQDLRRRDFTINACALPLSDGLSAGAVLDPRGGLADLRKRVVRAESDSLFVDDPLRILRAFRIAAQLGFAVEARTLSLIKRRRGLAGKPAGERIQAELMSLTSLAGCSEWLALMDRTGVLTSLIPELEPARKCALAYYGSGGVLKHSLETVRRADFLLGNLPAVFPRLAKDIARHLDELSAPGVSHRGLLILAALLHDVSKAATARKIGGRLRFFGHDELGAKAAAAILRRLRFSGDQIACIAAVVRHHLRPGNLAAGGALTDRAAYRFFRDTAPHSASLLLVCWSDHASYLSTAALSRLMGYAGLGPDHASLSRVRPAEARKTLYHLQLVASLLRRRFAPERKPVPDPLISGHDVMKAKGIPPGPEVGRVLEALREAQAEGKVRTRAEALAFARRMATQ